jgi:hypothetical protein
MSDIQEEQKRLYKRAKENDIVFLTKEQFEEYILFKKIKDLSRKELEEHLLNYAQILNYDKQIIEKLKNKINKSTDYIEQILEFIISKNIKEEKREYERLEHIINILQGDNK